MALGAVWLYEGLVPKLLFIRADQIELVQRSGLSFGAPQATLRWLGLAQVVFALWLLTGLAERLAVSLASVGMLVLMALVAGNNVSMFTDPYGALIKDLCLFACAFVVWELATPAVERPPE